VRLARPEAVRQVAVGRSVRELHRTGDAELGEAGEVLRREQLAVLDPRPEPAWLPDGARLLERIQRLAVRPVADRVHGDGEASVRAAARDPGTIVAARDPH